MKMFLTVCSPSWPSQYPQILCARLCSQSLSPSIYRLACMILRSFKEHTYTHMVFTFTKNKKNIISYWILFMWWEIPWNLSCRNISSSKTKTKTKIPTRSYIYYKHRHVYFLFVYKTTAVLYQNILYARVNEMSFFLHFSIIFINSKWKLLQILCHGLCISLKKQ